MDAGIGRFLQQADLVAFAQTLTPLRKAGHGFRGGCPCCGASARNQPFYVESGAGSTTPHWKCFACGEAGNVLHLVQLERTGQPSIPPAQLRGVLEAAATYFGIEAPPPPVRGLSQVVSHEERRAEVWGAVHESLAPETLGGNTSCGTFQAEAVLSRLVTLGYDATRLAKAGLSPEDLATFADGPVLLRTLDGHPSGITQEQSNADGSHGARWIHLGERTRGFDPLLLTAAPRGRVEDRVVGLALDVATARTARAAWTPETDRTRLPALGVSGVNDAVLGARWRKLTDRSVVLLPGPTTPTETVAERAHALLRHAVGVRVAAPIEAGNDVRRELTGAQDYVRWQAGAWMADLELTRGDPALTAVVGEALGPVVDALEEPLARRVLTTSIAATTGVAL